jgi:hypothetical protein
MDDGMNGREDDGQGDAAESGESGTRPLQDRSPRDEKRHPPAAVLSEAAPDWPASSPPASMEETNRVRAVPPAPEPRAWRVILQTLHPTQTRIGLNVWEELTIGRGGEGGADAPGLDLSLHQADELGISRRHAALVPGHDALYLVDLDSTNGTWINRRYLAPHQRYPLKPGDRIELGLLHIAVRLVEPLKR